MHTPHALSICCYNTTLQASDEMGSLLVMTLKHKLRSFAFCPTHPKGATAQLALGLTNNSVEVRLVGRAGVGFRGWVFGFRVSGHDLGVGVDRHCTA